MVDRARAGSRGGVRHRRDRLIPRLGEAPPTTAEDIAYHKAGYVVVAFRCGRHVRTVSLQDDFGRVPARTDGLGDVTQGLTILEPLPPGVDLRLPERRALRERETLISLAGELAAIRHRGGRRRAKDLSPEDLVGLTYAAYHAGPRQG